MSNASDEAGFLADICANPGEDTPRLVYADWLQEHGRERIANLIRWQCDRAEGWRRGVTLLNPRRGKLEGWVFSSGPGLLADQMAALIEIASSLPEPSGIWSGRCRIERGFVCQVGYCAADWFAHADTLAWHPGQTTECGKCVPDAEARVSHLSPIRERRRPDGSIERYQELEPFNFQVAKPPRSLCPTCSGAGRVARPCPPTAQPITRVALVGEPLGFDPFQVGHDDAVWGKVRAYSRPDRTFVTFRWPGITFTLPPEPV